MNYEEDCIILRIQTLSVQCIKRAIIFNKCAGGCFTSKFSQLL